jgi:asparagine synthase (glutamine-hydrolysing)
MAPTEMASEIETMIYHLDEPQPDPAPLNAYFISRLARENGIKVLLSGAGGDDIFTGYRRHHALMREGLWSWLPGPLRGAVAAVMRRLPVGHPALRRLVKVLQYAGRTGDARLVSYFFWLHPTWIRGLLAPEVAAELSPASDVGAPLLETLGRLGGDTHVLDRMMFLECKHFLPDHNLAYTDKMAMAAGVEVRVPMLDTELVEHAFGLPVDLRQRGREGKWVLKRAMEPYLPRDVIYRPKSGFGAPLRRWLRHDLAERVEDVLSEETLRRRGLFDPAGVRRLVEADRAGRVDAAYTIFGLMCVEIWCRLFVDPPVPVPRTNGAA